MGRLYVMSYAKNQELGVKKRTLPRQVTLGPTALKYIAVVIFAALGIIYLAGQTRGANESIVKRDLDSQQSQLQKKIDDLQVESSRLRNLQKVYDQSATTQMQPSTKINYLPSTPPVAKK